MKIAVCIKQVPDTETKISLSNNPSGIDESSIKWIMNPYDEFAVEEALALKAKVPDSTVTVFSVGPKRCTDSLRTALAMGADDAVLITTDQPVDSFTAAQGLCEAIKKEGPYDLYFSGKLAIDGNASAVTQMLGELLEIPHATVVSKFEFNDGRISVEREVEGGQREVFELHTPAIVGANKGLNTPRYASLPGIMKAKKKPLKEFSLEELGIGGDSIKISFSNFELPAEKPPIKMIDGDPAQQAKALTQLLREEAKVL